MLIDNFLPEYQFSKVHRQIIDAPADIVYKNLLTINFGESSIIKTLFKLRGLPESMITLQGMQKAGFTLLGEVPEREILFGLAGRFWALNGDLQSIEPGTFRSFNKAGFAKTAWNFSLNVTGINQTELITETRIHCTDQNSFRKFRAYWFFIGPFSSLIRKRMLILV